MPALPATARLVPGAPPGLRAALAAALCALALPATALAGRSPPTHLRWPLQSDFDRCALAATDRGQLSLQGRLRLELLVRKEGNVYGAFVHNTIGVDDRPFLRCLTSGAQLWVLPPVPIDYRRAYELSVVGGGSEMDMSSNLYWQGYHPVGQGRPSVFMPDIDDPPKPAALEVQLARETLELADWATDAERGTAELSVQRWPQAIAAFRAALSADPSDPVALRGLAQALVESGGDAGEARTKAALLAALQPGSVGGQEALLRVCLASGDDECAYRAFQAAGKAPDLAPRSRLIAELQPATEAAAGRLRAAALTARRFDTCAGAPDDRTLALCLVRRCLDEGSAAWALERKGTPGEWAIAPGGAGRYLASRPLAVPGEEDPRWLVTVGPASVRITPVNAAARHLSQSRSRCEPLGLAPGQDRSDGSIEQPVVRAGTPVRRAGQPSPAR